MAMSIILGLSAAICWGVTDFLARYASRELGAYRSMFFMQAFGLGLLSLVWLGMGRDMVLHATRAAWAWDVVGGVLSTAAVLALYRSFETGKLAVVAPISAGYPALTALLAIASGEQVTAGRWAGIGLVLAGVALTVGAAGSAEMGLEAGATAQNPRAGVGWALAAAVGFGVMFWLLGFHVVPELGGFMSVWLLRLVATLGLGVAAVPARQSLRIPRQGMVWMLVAMGALDVGAYLSNNFGMEFRHVSIVTVIASLYAAVTVLLAAVVLREKLNWKQWIGVALIFAGVVVLSA
jgi:drug/metabolite transporter (DMT)-like permease